MSGPISAQSLASKTHYVTLCLVVDDIPNVMAKGGADSRAIQYNFENKFSTDSIGFHPWFKIFKLVPGPSIHDMLSQLHIRIVHQTPAANLAAIVL
jgi:hypothetical protein